MSKDVVETLFTVLLCMLVATALLGVNAKRMRDTFTADMSAHRMAAYICLVLYLASITATHLMVVAHGGEVASRFFVPHLFFAIVSFVTFLLALRFNGNHKREWHRPLVYTCIGTYIVAFALALPLLRLF